MKVMAGSLRVMCVAVSRSKEVSKLKARPWEYATFVPHLKVIFKAFSFLLYPCLQIFSAWLRGRKYVQIGLAPWSQVCCI